MPNILHARLQIVDARIHAIAPSCNGQRVERKMRLIQLMLEILPPSAVLAGGSIDPEIGFLFAEEEALARPMSANRRHEFAAGRYYAHEALHALGCPSAPIAIQPSRAPAWPQGVVGTISHSRGQCAAVVAWRSNLRSVGVDIEAVDPLPTNLVPFVCRPADLNGRFAVERLIGVDLPKLVFVLKEAFYKAYHFMTGSFLDFVDVEVAVDPALCAFEARLVNDNRPSCGGYRVLGGRFGRVQDTLFAATWVTSSDVKDCTLPRFVQ
jgi:4'-phosphopantetheinyl transferase EntD